MIPVRFCARVRIVLFGLIFSVKFLPRAGGYNTAHSSQNGYDRTNADTASPTEIYRDHCHAVSEDGFSYIRAGIYKSRYGGDVSVLFEALWHMRDQHKVHTVHTACYQSQTYHCDSGVFAEKYVQ